MAASDLLDKRRKTADSAEAENESSSGEESDDMQDVEKVLLIID